MVMQNGQNPNPSDEEVQLDPEQSPDEQDDSKFIRLSKDNLFQDIVRLEREDEAFRQAFGTHLGRRAKQRYESQVNELKLDNERLQREARKLQVMGLPEAEINKRYAEDPAFAREYTELVHNQDSYESSLEGLRATRTWESMYAEAEAQGVPAEVIDAVREGRTKGKYDKDDDGREISWQEALPLMQRDLMTGLRAHLTKPSNPPEEKQPEESKPIPKVSDKLSRVTPDTSTRSKSSTSYTGLTQDKLKSMSQEEVNSIPMEVLDRVMAGG